jgi:hypothetical protein
MMGAVHGFKQKLFSFFGGLDGLERILAVLFIVARGYVEGFSPYVRCNHSIISSLDLSFSQELLEALTDDRSFREPKRKAQSDFFGKGKEFKFFAKLPVVPLFCFLENMEVFLKFFLLSHTPG